MSTQKPLTKVLMYVLPSMALVFTAWLPSCLQLSFFVTGMLSALQAVALRNPQIRQALDIAPLTPRAAPATTPEEPQGTLRLRADQYDVAGHKRSNIKTYKTLFLNRERIAPPGMDTEKYEQAKAALASGRLFEFRRLFSEAVVKAMGDRLPLGGEISSLGPGTYEAPRKPAGAGWKSTIEDAMNPLKAKVDTWQQDAQAKMKRDNEAKFEARRAEEDRLTDMYERQLKQERQMKRREQAKRHERLAKVKKRS